MDVDRWCYCLQPHPIRNPMPVSRSGGGRRKRTSPSPRLRLQPYLKLGGALAIGMALSCGLPASWLLRKAARPSLVPHSRICRRYFTPRPARAQEAGRIGPNRAARDEMANNLAAREAALLSRAILLFLATFENSSVELALALDGRGSVSTYLMPYHRLSANGNCWRGGLHDISHPDDMPEAGQAQRPAGRRDLDYRRHHGAWRKDGANRVGALTYRSPASPTATGLLFRSPRTSL